MTLLVNSLNKQIRIESYANTLIEMEKREYSALHFWAKNIKDMKSWQGTYMKEKWWMDIPLRIDTPPKIKSYTICIGKVWNVMTQWHLFQDWKI